MAVKIRSMRRVLLLAGAVLPVGLGQTITSPDGRVIREST